MRGQIIVVGFGVLLTAAAASAHHSFSAEFDIEQPVTLQGTLTELEWVNPHGWLHLDVAGSDGVALNWAVELGNPTALLRRGLRKSDFPAGLEVVVEGYKAKDGTPTANGITITFPDGRNIFAGSSGTGAPEPAPR
ncbi:MAG: DUF6152 family protein [Acidobacteriota bacterium]|nr:DUF6152 family protein [Acidobacteriota bacterium]